MNLEALLNNLITSGIQLADPDTIRRIKILNIFHLVFIMVAPILGLFYFFIGAPILFYICIISGILMIPGIVILRKNRNMALVGNYGIFILWMTLTIISWNTGAVTYEGIIKPALILNAGLILLSIFLNGYLSGTVWAAVVFIQTGLIIYLYRNGYQFKDLIPPEIADTYSMGTYMIALLCILLFAFLFEKEKSDAMLREQEKAYALKESKKYIDDIFDRSPLPSFIIDRSHRVIQWNRACQELTGIPSQEILGHEVWDGFRINDQGSIADIIIDNPDSINEYFADNIKSQTESGWFELDMHFPKLKGGKRAIVTAAPILDNNSVTRGAIQTIQEVMEEKSDNLTENCLEDSFGKPVFKIDPQGKINFWNRASEERLGYTSSRILGNSPLAFVAKNYRQTFKETMSRVYKGEHFTNSEWRYQAEDGKPVYVMARAFPMPSANGDGVECVIVNTDVTELKLQLKKLSQYASAKKEELKILTEEHELLKKNIATFIRKKDEKPVV